MSLFKAKDFWSFELEQLHHQSSSSGDERKTSAADYVVATGRFEATGDEQDVIVAANLRGFLYLIQVPDQDLQHPHDTEQQAAESRSRQLLALQKTAEPVVDVKCGHFISSLKQSVAALTFDKLIVYHVTRRKPELISISSTSSSIEQEDPVLVDSSFLSHEFEQQYSIDLALDCMAQKLLVLRNQAAHNCQELNASSSKQHGVAMRSVMNQQMQLPQREKLIVQYTNQFVLTLVDYKKSVVTFQLHLGSNQPNEARNYTEEQLRASGECFGPVPIAYLHNEDGERSAALVVALSDHRIYSIFMSKLNHQVKQDVVRRVAFDLVQQQQQKHKSTTDFKDRPTISGRDRSSNVRQMSPIMEQDKVALKRGKLIRVELESSAEWIRELPAEPIEMLGLQRLACEPSNSVASLHQQQNHHHPDAHYQAQLLVMMRYQLDLYSHLGENLWSMRHEAPLICIYAFTIDSLAQKGEMESTTTKATMKMDAQRSVPYGRDQLITLIGTECLDENKSSLLVANEDQLAWSALLESRPLQIWRMNSSQVRGLIGTLCVREGFITASYLGTGSKDDDDDEQLDDSEMASEGCLAELLQLDEDVPSPGANSKDGIGHLEDLLIHLPGEKNLLVNVELEAASGWQSKILCQIDVWPAPNSTRMLHNVTLRLEFDDLLRVEFELVDAIRHSDQISPLGPGFIQARLGNCWPDRIEPMRIKCSVVLAKHSMHDKSGSEAMSRLEEADFETQTSDSSDSLLPKTLEVKLYLDYYETQMGCVIQEESFLLPLNLLISLAHIDYTAGQNQSLSDVLFNLGHLYRFPVSDEAQQASKSAHHFCDIFFNVGCEFIELIDELTEKDLICRSKRSDSPLTDHGRSLILEKIDLLAQSLDCKLRYRSPTSIVRQPSEEQSMPVMVSFAFKFGNFYESLINQMSSLDPMDQKRTVEEQDLVWVHVCDIGSGAELAQELIAVHKARWLRNQISDPEAIMAKSSNNAFSSTQIYLSIECEHAGPILFFGRHLFNRLNRFKLQHGSTWFANPIPKAIGGMSYHELVELLKCRREGIIAHDSELNNDIELVIQKYKPSLEVDLKKTREKLAQELFKFQISTSASLSMAKRLADLSEDSISKVDVLASMVKLYRSNMITLVDRIESIQAQLYKITKLPMPIDHHRF